METASDLLQVYRHKGPMKGTPALMEFNVPPTPPYLVTSSRRLFWLTRSHQDKIRAAVREIEVRSNLYLEIIDAVTEEGIRREWGNVHPLTTEGLEAAVEHVTFYGLKDLKILSHPDTWMDMGFEHAPGTFGGAAVVPVQWIGEGTMVVIPGNREFLGFVLELGGNLMVSVVHNASRGMSVVRR